jgi:hypothetical protein
MGQQTSKTYVEADWSGGNTAPLALNWRGGVSAVQVTVTGTVNFDIQSTNSNLNAGEAADWLVDAAANSSITASKFFQFTGDPRFMRIKVNSGGTGATITIKLVQSDV